MAAPIKVTLYRWAGSWGPFKVNIPCGECTLTKDILTDTFANELADVPVELEVKDWLSHWWEPLKAGAWHAPIVMVEGKVISQGEALNRGVLVQSIIKAWTEHDTLSGNIVFGKATCPYCVKAKALLDEAGILWELVCAGLLEAADGAGWAGEPEDLSGSGGLADGDGGPFFK